MNGISKYLETEKLPCFYSHTVFEKAAIVFDHLRHRPRSLDDAYETLVGQRARKIDDKSCASIPLRFASLEEMRLTYELVHATLGYQFILQRLILDTSFFIVNPHLLEVEPLVVVMLCNSQQRKFQPLPNRKGDDVSEDVSSVDLAIRSVACKMNAGLARIKINSNVRSLDELLPVPSCLKIHATERMTVIHAWINQLKTSKDYVINALAEDSYGQSNSEEVPSGRSYRIDTLCDDTLAFSPDIAKEIANHHLVKNGHLVLQDYTSCLAARAMCDAMKTDGSIVHLDDGNGKTTAHLASLMKERKCSRQILRFSTCFALFDRGSEVADRLRMLGATDVELLDENFSSIDPHDPRLRSVTAALQSAHCSKTAVVDPVSFLLTDSDDIQLLKYSTCHAPPLEDFGKRLTEQLSQLKRLLSVPSIQEVVYATRSCTASENEDCIFSALDYSRQEETPTLKSFRIMALIGQASHSSVETTQDKFLCMHHSNLTNGCFIAGLRRQVVAEPPKEAPKDILAKAAALGLLGSDDQQLPVGGSPKVQHRARPSPLARRKLKKPKKVMVAFGSSVSTTKKERKMK